MMVYLQNIFHAYPAKTRYVLFVNRVDADHPADHYTVFHHFIDVVRQLELTGPLQDEFISMK